MKGKQMLKKLLITVLSIFMSVSISFAMEIGGVTMPDTLKSDTADLILNGAGLRKKYGFKVYAGALYLTQKSSDGAAIIDSTDPMAIKMVWRRGAPIKKINQVFQESFNQAAGDQYNALKTDIESFMSWITSQDAEKNDTWTYIFEPGKGVLVYVKRGDDEKLMGTLSNPEFKKILFKIWLGEPPCDKELKEGMLG